MIQEIKHIATGDVLFSGEYDTLKQCVEAAVKAEADLRGADLRWADLAEADLRRADLAEADLRWADLNGAGLAGANLRGTNLNAANLNAANLRGANLSGTNLSGADLIGADFSGANLHGANLRLIKEDFQQEVVKLPEELPQLRAALVEGRIDGRVYAGECCCLAGTLAKACDTIATDGLMLKNNYRVCADSPRECWFLGINAGDTPDNSQISAITLEWLDEVIANVHDS